MVLHLMSNVGQKDNLMMEISDQKMLEFINLQSLLVEICVMLKMNRRRLNGKLIIAGITIS